METRRLRFPVTVTVSLSPRSCRKVSVGMDGIKAVMGIWLEKNEGTKFRLSVFTEHKDRGMNDVLIACVDGLQGLPEAIESVFPHAEVQLCIVHIVRNSLKFVSYKDRKKIAALKFF